MTTGLAPPRAPDGLHPLAAPRRRLHAGALLPRRPHRTALLGVFHRSDPKPQHAPCVFDCRSALRRLVQAPRPRHRTARAHGDRGLRRAALRRALLPERQAAPAGAALALRLTRRRLGPPLQPGELGAGIQACRQDRQGPVLSAAETRALLGILIYSFARVTAAVSLRVTDYYTQGHNGRRRGRTWA